MNSSFYNRLLCTASIFGIIGVSFGAFGAHFLKSRLQVEDLDILRTGVLYLFVHTLATLFVIVLSAGDLNSRHLKGSGLLFVIGIILFSGSLFLIATRSLTMLPTNYIGILTPVGGLCFILAWSLLFLYAFSRNR